MGQNVTNGTVNMSGSVQVQASVTVPTGGTLVCVDLDSTGGTTDMYTVPAGKTLYITSAYAALQTASGYTSVDADVTGTGTYVKIVSTLSVSPCSLSFPIAVTVPATKKVRNFVAGALGRTNAGFTGYII